MKTPRAFVQGEAKKRSKKAALGAPVVVQGAPKLSDYSKLSPLKIGADSLMTTGLKKPKKPR